MQSWQYWMAQGNSAYQQQQLSHAVYCYRQALADVWPVWYHCAFVCCPVELSIEEACLPTHCFAVVLLNLAETYAKAGQWRLCQRTLAQGLFWFRRMLQQNGNNNKFTIAVLQQQAALTTARAQYQRQQQHCLQSVVTTHHSSTKPTQIAQNVQQPHQTDFSTGELPFTDTSGHYPAKDEQSRYKLKGCETNNSTPAARPLLH